MLFGKVVLLTPDPINLNGRLGEYGDGRRKKLNDGFALGRGANCVISVTCKDRQQCPPVELRSFKFNCSLNYKMHDYFEHPTDFDNSGGTDFWDKWNYGGAPFYVDGSWSSTVSGGGKL